MTECKYKLKWEAEIEVTEDELRDFCTGRSLWNQPGWDNFAAKANELWEDINYQKRNRIEVNDRVSVDIYGKYYLDRNGDYQVTHLDDDGYVYARKFK